MFRHGETTSDKTNPNRSLTKNGIICTVKQASKLTNIINANSCEIFSTNTIRTINTAKILARELSINFREEYCVDMSSFLIKGWDLIRDTTNKDLTKIYLDLINRNQLPPEITTPLQVTQRFLEAIANTNTQATTIILVANGGSIEIASYFQNTFRPRSLKLKILNYSEFLILNKY